MAHHNGTGTSDQEMQSVYPSMYEGEPEKLGNFELSSDFILETGMSQEKMETDSELPNPTNTNNTILKRSTSAPMMNGIGDSSQAFQADTVRIRRNSSTFINRPNLLFTPSSIRTSINRIDQIKQEEGVNLAAREAMTEWEVQTAIQISQSWERCLTLNDNDVEKPSSLTCTDLISVLPEVSPRSGIGKVGCTSSPTGTTPSLTRRFVISHNPTNIIRPSILGPIKRKGEVAREDPPKKVFIATDDNELSSDVTKLTEDNVSEKI
ncbi:P2R1A-PPP2R2A-interacting phosphatase regulator 1-like isoform X2 [Ochotona princeps]|uniref:P2R1A-PPP2R2A-interacting phosphatase regulator 1-like isoform X2 n=1 Tax=Ochotona princeps TaxID=9978 RepID=UPI00271557A5|nr:P2R1A-PPP2R2A-interacting phosphatase regulator 1-like isoform X2 [Ochotona princeps]